MTLPPPSPADCASDAALLVDDIVKDFGTTRAVDHLSFQVKPATVLALLGPNGAGKTTTIEACEGFITPTSGSIRVLGLDPTKDPHGVRQRIGIMLQEGGAYPGIHVGEMLKLVASYSAHPLDPDSLLEIVGLSRHAKATYRRLSGGQKQRLSLACALVGRPELIFLDEPTAGMDAQSRLAVWNLVKCLTRDGVTTILTTHLMDEAEALADQVVIIDHGTAVASGSLAELTRASEDTRIQLVTDTAIDESRLIAEFTRTHMGTHSTPLTITARRPLAYTITMPTTPESMAALTAALAEQGVLARSIEIEHHSLEDVFLQLTGREMRG